MANIEEFRASLTAKRDTAKQMGSRAVRANSPASGYYHHGRAQAYSKALAMLADVDPEPGDETLPDSGTEPADLGVITHICICGGNLWRVLVTWDDYEIATYSLDMYCVECGAKAIAPTALDRP